MESNKQRLSFSTHIGGGLFRSLKEVNYRRYFIGQGVSVMGTWMQTVALSWLVYQLTSSAALLGVVAFLSQAPQLVVSPLAGLLSDRFDRRRLLVIVQWLLFLQAFMLALLSFTGWIKPWHIVTISTCFGVLNAVDIPMRHSLIGSLVSDKRDLPNAIALNAVVYNAARFIAPPIAGALLGLTSESLCFLFNALSYLVIGLALQRMQLTDAPREMASLGNSFGEGVRFVLSTPPVRALLALTLVLNISASSYVVMVPVLAKQVYGGGAETLGILLGASGCGALAATAYLAWQRGNSHLADNVFKGWLAVSASIVLLTATGWLLAGMAAVCVLGFGLSMANVATNASLISCVPDALRGRMISYYTAIRFGMDAVGGLLAGALVSGVGLRPTLIAETVVVLAGMGWLLWRRTHLYGDLSRMYEAVVKPV